MKAIHTSAPGKVILFGEHAVVHDRLGIAGAIGMRASVSFVPRDDDGVILHLPKYLKDEELTLTQCVNFYKEIARLKELKDFDGLRLLNKDPINPLKAVVGFLKPSMGFEATFNSDLMKNTGSGSAVFSSLAAAILYRDNAFDRRKVAAAAYEGDVVAHAGLPSGIDNSTVTYGQYLTFKRSLGPQPLQINFKIPLVIVDSGTPANTGDMVMMVKKRLEREPNEVNQLLDSIDQVSHKAMEAIKKGETLKTLGGLMNNNHELLQKLGVCTKQLDDIVTTARLNGALGAKMTGGGGGGSIIVLTEHPKRLAEKFGDDGFRAYATLVGAEGVRLE